MLESRALAASCKRLLRLLQPQLLQFAVSNGSVLTAANLGAIHCVIAIQLQALDLSTAVVVVAAAERP